MKAPIENKDGVLQTLRQRLGLCQLVLRHSRENGEPPAMQKNGEADERSLLEAIRFIEEHASDLGVDKDETQTCNVMCCSHLAPHDRIPPTLDGPSFLNCDLPAEHAPIDEHAKHSCQACRTQCKRRAEYLKKHANDLT